MKTKFCSMVLCIVMLCSFCLTGVVSADGDIMYDLTSLGITGNFGFENHLDSNITRAEFAQLVVNMMNQKDVATTMESAHYFTDIAESPYRGAINLLYRTEIISGTGEGIFDPNRNVRYTEACKMLVKALGYHVIVSDTSLSSYTFLAGTIGVTENVDSSKEYITVKDMLVMVDNCLDIGKMVPMYYNDNIAPSYIIDEDETFRNGFEKPTPNGTIKMEGIVTGDVSSYLYKNRTTLKDTQLEISDKIFDFEGTAPLGFVGKHVYFYVNVDAEGNYGKVSSITATNKNTVVAIDGSDIASYSNTQINFYINSSKISKIDTNLSTKWLYNGVPGSYILDSIDMNGNVQIVAVDNNEDGIFDVVSVYEYEDALVLNTDVEKHTLSFETDLMYNNEKNISLDEKEEKIHATYFNAKGERTTFDTIKSGDIVSIAKSIDGKKYRIVISDNGGTGFAESKDGDYIVMGTTEYKLLGLNPARIRLGRNYDYKVNFLNRLVYAEEIKVESDYAYLYQFSGTSGLGTPKVKLIIPAKVASKTLQGDFNEATNTVVSSTNLYIRNENILIYKLANKITLEYWTNDAQGNEYLAKQKVEPTAEKLNLVLNQPVSFEVDENNNIIRLSQLSKHAEGINMTYNSSEKVFGRSALATPFGIAENTYAVCIPTNNATDEDMLNYIQELLNSMTTVVSSYDVDEETHIANMLVFNAEMVSGKPGSLGSSRKFVGMVTKASRIYDEKNDEEVLKITMLTKGNGSKLSEQSFIVSPIIDSYTDFYKINAGDLIKYSLDGFDRLDAFHILQKFDSYFDGSNGFVNDDYTVCGTVTDIDYDEISNTKLRWADVLTMKNMDASYTYNLFHASNYATHIFILDSSDRSSEIGKVSDIKYGDRVLVYAYAGDPYVLVIYR